MLKHLKNLILSMNKSNLLKIDKKIANVCFDKLRRVCLWICLEIVKIISFCDKLFKLNLRAGWPDVLIYKICTYFERPNLSFTMKIIGKSYFWLKFFKKIYRNLSFFKKCTYFLKFLKKCTYF